MVGTDRTLKEATGNGFLVTFKTYRFSPLAGREHRSSSRPSLRFSPLRLLLPFPINFHINLHHQPRPARPRPSAGISRCCLNARLRRMSTPSRSGRGSAIPRTRSPATSRILCQTCRTTTGIRLVPSPSLPKRTLNMLAPYPTFCEPISRP